MSFHFRLNYYFMSPSCEAMSFLPWFNPITPFYPSFLFSMSLIFPSIHHFSPPSLTSLFRPSFSSSISHFSHLSFLPSIPHFSCPALISLFRSSVHVSFLLLLLFCTFPALSPPLFHAFSFFSLYFTFSLLSPSHFSILYFPLLDPFPPSFTASFRPPLPVSLLLLPAPFLSPSV